MSLIQSTPMYIFKLDINVTIVSTILIDEEIKIMKMSISTNLRWVQVLFADIFRWEEQNCSSDYLNHIRF